MKKVFLLIFALVAFANAQFFYDKHGESRGAYKDSMDYATLVELAQRFRGPILVKKPVEGVKPRKNLEKISQDIIQRTFDVNRDSLRDELWLEVEKNEIVKVCVDQKVLAWETSLNSSIINDSCIALQAPTLAGSEKINVFFPDESSPRKINLAVSMKHLNFKNEEVLLGFNNFSEEDLKTPSRCVTDEGISIDCSLSNEDPERLTSITASYLIDKYPVTNCEFTQVMWDSIPKESLFQEAWSLRKKTSVHQSSCNVHDTAASEVTLYQAIKYANARSIREGLKPYYVIIKTDAEEEKILSQGYIISYRDFNFAFNQEGFVLVSEDKTSTGYRLPYYDEWMMFARGGDKKNKVPWGDPKTVLFKTVSKYATFTTAKPTSKKEIHLSEPVGQKLPNGYGLYDMFGLVWEFVLMKKEISGNFNNPSCVKGGGYRIDFVNSTLPFNKCLRSINYGLYDLGSWGKYAGFRLIRNIGNNATWEKVEAKTK